MAEPKEKLSDEFWATFDLDQDKFAPKLDLKLSCPLVVIPNLDETTERFELDFGTITISSTLVEEKGRWVNHPDKLFRSMGMTYHNSNLSFDFKKDGSSKEFKPILKEDNVVVEMLIPNSSRFFPEDDKAPLRVDTENHTLDMEQVDKAVVIGIKQKFMKLHLK